MRRNEVYALAVAYLASRDERHYRGLQQSELEAFWSHVDRIRLRHRFWLDQRGVRA